MPTNPELLAMIDSALAETVCRNCGGDGDLGQASDGRLISCESCGGHEDALGCGYSDPVKAAALQALRDILTAAQGDLLSEGDYADATHWADGGDLDYTRRVSAHDIAQRNIAIIAAMGGETK